MPIYQYVCDDCGYDFERMQSFKDDPVRKCPTCEGNVRRVISSVGVIFKGSGWYITDSRRQLSGSAKGTGARRHLSDAESDTKPASDTSSGGDAGAEGSGAKADEKKATTSADGGDKGAAGGAKDAKPASTAKAGS